MLMFQSAFVLKIPCNHILVDYFHTLKQFLNWKLFLTVWIKWFFIYILYILFETHMYLHLFKKGQQYHISCVRIMHINQYLYYTWYHAFVQTTCTVMLIMMMTWSIIMLKWYRSLCLSLQLSLPFVKTWCALSQSLVGPQSLCNRTYWWRFCGVS